MTNSRTIKQLSANQSLSVTSYLNRTSLAREISLHFRIIPSISFPNQSYTPKQNVEIHSGFSLRGKPDSSGDESMEVFNTGWRIEIELHAKPVALMLKLDSLHLSSSLIDFPATSEGNVEQQPGMSLINLIKMPDVHATHCPKPPIKHNASRTHKLDLTKLRKTLSIEQKGPRPQQIFFFNFDCDYKVYSKSSELVYLLSLPPFNRVRKPQLC